MKTAISLLTISGLLAGCATVPEVAYHYYPAKVLATATVVQSVDCTPDKQGLVLVNTPDVKTQYEADRAARPVTINFRQKTEAFSDNSRTFSFFSDGRLKSVNATSTGQGEAILKSVISLVGAVAPLGGGGTRALAPLPECKVIADWGGGKPVTINYKASIDFNSQTDAGIPFTIEPVPDSAALHRLLEARLPILQGLITPSASGWAGATFDQPAGSRKDHVYLKLRKVRNAQLDLLAQGQKLWSGNVLVPDARTEGEYVLPIPHAALFGEQSFAMTLTEAGAIETITYGKKTGAAGPLNVLTAAATAAAPDSAAARAAELKGESDLIVQQQRLVRCRAQPDQCQ